MTTRRNPGRTSTRDQTAAHALAVEVDEIKRRLRAIETTDQLANSSLVGALRVTDEDGNVTMSVGQQEDGEPDVVITDPTLPSTPAIPTPPVLTAVSGGLLVDWDGAFADGSAAASTFDHIEVHADDVSNFPATTTDTLVGTMDTARGMTLFVALPAVDQYVRLVAVNRNATGSVRSAPSVQTMLRPLPAAPILLLEAGASVPAGTPVGTLIFEKA